MATSEWLELLHVLKKSTYPGTGLRTGLGGREERVETARRIPGRSCILLRPSLAGHTASLLWYSFGQCSPKPWTQIQEGKTDCPLRWEEAYAVGYVHLWKTVYTWEDNVWTKNNFIYVLFYHPFSSFSSFPLFLLFFLCLTFFFFFFFGCSVEICSERHVKSKYKGFLMPGWTKWAVL